MKEIIKITDLKNHLFDGMSIMVGGVAGDKREDTRCSLYKVCDPLAIADW